MTLPGGGTWTYDYASWTVGMNGTPPFYRNYWNGFNHIYTLQPKDDPGSLSPILNKITDDQGREVSINMDIFGTVHRTTFNKAYDSYGSLVSYCDSITQLDNENTGETHRWLGETETTRHWVNPNGYGWYSRVLNQNDYGYDLAGNRASNTISIQGLNSDGSPQVDANNNPILNSRTEQYGYDELSRLTSVDYGDGESQTYGFDPLGNRLQKTDTVGGTTTTENYSYNNANMLLSRGSNGYTNDAAGNTLTGGGRTNTWDSENRLTQCVYNGTTSNFVYGSDGLRRQMSVASGGATTTTNFAIDGDGVVREMRDISGTLTPTATYFNGMYRRDDLSGSLRWYVFDGLGSVVGEVDPTGGLTCNRGYDVYGATRSSTGTPTSKHGFVGRLGHPTDDETGLIYMRARYYDPAVGRFVSEDPGRDGGNWYVYANSSPVNCSDRDGKKPHWVTGLAFVMGFTLTTAAILTAIYAAGSYSCFRPLAMKGAMLAAIYMSIAAVAFFGIAIAGVGYFGNNWVGGAIAAVGNAFFAVIGVMVGGVEEAGKLNLPGVGVAVTAAFTDGLMALASMVSDEDLMRRTH